MNVCKWSGLILLLLISAISFGQKADSVLTKSSLIKRSSFTPIPILSYSRSYGATVGVMLNAFTVINKADTISPPSMTGIGIGYTQNKSWFTIAFQRLFLKQDKLRVVWALGLGKTNFQFFQETDDLGNGVFVDYKTHTKFVSATVTYNIFSRFYTGLKYQYSKSTTEFDVANQPDQIANLSGFGLPVSFDNRDYVYNPAKGWNINAVFNNNAKWMGSDIEFSSLSFNANNYTRLNSKGVLASRFFVYGGLGNVPFIGQKVVGGKDLRGYTKGTYRSNSVAALQTEYRYNFYKKWGAVAFGGIANAFKVNGISGSGILPAAGFGVRYLVIPKQRMNMGFDAAVGKNDWGVYFRIGEAF
ncbi:MAG: hypothetical protein RIS73_1399 [Bacteroidota bacterium]|jgi:Omp85 superfamily domain